MRGETGSELEDTFDVLVRKLPAVPLSDSSEIGRLLPQRPGSWPVPLSVEAVTRCAIFFVSLLARRHICCRELVFEYLVRRDYGRANLRSLVGRETNQEEKNKNHDGSPASHDDLRDFSNPLYYARVFMPVHSVTRARDGRHIPQVHVAV